MQPSLFRSGLLPRAAAAVAFGLVAFGAVYGVSRPSPRAARPEASEPANAPVSAHRDSSPETSASTEGERVIIESVLPVAEWTVRLDGESVNAAESDAHRWSATVPAPAALLSIDVSMPAGTTASANSLRIRLESGRVRIEWVEWTRPGDLMIVALDALRAGQPPPAAAAP